MKPIKIDEETAKMVYETTRNKAVKESILSVYPGIDGDYLKDFKEFFS